MTAKFPPLRSNDSIDDESTDDQNLEVDSEDIDTSPWGRTEPFSLKDLLQNMSPSKCLQPAADVVSGCSTTAYKSCLGSERDELDHQIPGLLKELHAGNKARTAALQKLYRLTDREHRQNRLVSAISGLNDRIQMRNETNLACRCLRHCSTQGARRMHNQI